LVAVLAHYMHDPKAEVNRMALRIRECGARRGIIDTVTVDHRTLNRVAWTIATAAISALGCGPTFKPPPPDVRPGAVGVVKSPAVATRIRQVVVGEMCPKGADGRPAIAPLFMRGISWTDNAGEVASAVERGSVPRFTVFGVDGGVAGKFDTLGIVDVGLRQHVAAGTYTGAAPCSGAAQSKPTAGTIVTRTTDPKCEAATAGCGVAVGELAHPGDPPPAPVVVTGGACVAGDQLTVDVDGDGRFESFPVAGVLDGIRSPAAEWSGTPNAAQPCRPAFQLYGIQLPHAADPGKPADKKSAVTLDVLGVLDLDGDGRRELVLALKFATVRTIVVYTATATPQRLELVGEATSFASGS